MKTFRAIGIILSIITMWTCLSSCGGEDDIFYRTVPVLPQVTSLNNKVNINEDRYTIVINPNKNTASVSIFCDYDWLLEIRDTSQPRIYATGKAGEKVDLSLPHGITFYCTGTTQDHVNHINYIVSANIEVIKDLLILTNKIKAAKS